MSVNINTREQVKATQRQLNTMGANLKVDGVWGPKTEAAYNQYSASKTTPTVTKQIGSTGTSYSTSNFQQGAYTGSNYAAPAPPKPQISSYTGRKPGSTATSIGLKDDTQQEQKKPSATGYYTGTGLNAGKTTGMSSSEREIRNMIKESNMTPFQASNFESALGMKDEKLNSALLAEMQRDGTQAVSQRMQTQRKAASTTTASNTPANTQGVYDPEKTGGGLGGWGTPNLKKDPVPVPPGGNKEKGKSTTVKDSAQGLYDPAKIGAGLGGWGAPNLKQDPVPVPPGNTMQEGKGTAPTFRDATQIPAKDTTAGRDAYRTIFRMTDLTPEQRAELWNVVDENNLSFVRALNKDMRTSSPESIYSTYVTRAFGGNKLNGGTYDAHMLQLREQESKSKDESGISKYRTRLLPGAPVPTLMNPELPVMQNLNNANYLVRESTLDKNQKRQMEQLLEMNFRMGYDELNADIAKTMQYNGVEAAYNQYLGGARETSEAPANATEIDNGAILPGIKSEMRTNQSEPNKDEILSVRDTMRNSDIPPIYQWQFEKTLNAIATNGFEGPFGEVNRAIYEEMKNGGLEELAGRASNADKVILGVSDKGVGAMELYRSKDAKMLAEKILTNAKSIFPDWITDFLESDEYQSTEIGITANGQLGFSISSSVGYAFDKAFEQRQSTQGNSRGSGQIGISACAYILRSTAPYEVLVNEDSAITFIGGSMGYGSVVGANQIYIKSENGDIYSGLMIMAGIGASVLPVEIHAEKSF